MLARVRGGTTGVVEYLVDGVKSGRELSRDELDLRVCIDGNLQLTDSIIKQINSVKDSEAYLHITLSFGEREIDQEKIEQAYNQYKRLVMSAYNDDEYNVYAEIHYPKVKSYIDRKTGEKIERFPHVHMVIPKINLISNKSLAPFGVYRDNINYHDAIQESVNRELSLESPYDNQRKYRLINDNADFISRYKGDAFKGSNTEFKRSILEVVNESNIRTLDDFEKLLQSYGEVSRGKAGSDSEYFKVKLEGQSKFIRLKEPCFKPAYIEKRELHREKPTDRQIHNLLSEWKSTRSHELKYVHPSSQKVRDKYYSLDEQQKNIYLRELATYHNSKYLNRKNNETKQSEKLESKVLTSFSALKQGLPNNVPKGLVRTNNNTKETLNEQRQHQEHLRQGRRQTNRELGSESIKYRGFTPIANGLPSLSERSLVRTDSRRSAFSKSLLSSNANHHLESSRENRDHQLRRLVVRRRGSDPRERTRSRTYASYSGKRIGERAFTGFPPGLEHLNSLVKQSVKRAHTYSNRAGVDGSRSDKQLSVGLPHSLKPVKTKVLTKTGKPKSVAEQYRDSYIEDEVKQRELDFYRGLRKKLDPERVLNHFERTHGLVRDNYTVFRVKDGARIKVGGRAFNLTDFCTHHMHQNWDETKALLSSLYQARVTEKQERHVINSIAFASRYVTQNYSSETKLARLEETMHLFRYLVRQEQYGETSMALSDISKFRSKIGEENAISNAELELKALRDNFKRQHALADKLTLKMSDLVPTKDLKAKRITFKDVKTGNELFRDVGDKIIMASRDPDVNHIAVAMTLAAEKFGTVKISGTKEFKQQVIDVAVAKELNVVFADKEMQALFIKCRDEFIDRPVQDKAVSGQKSSVDNYASKSAHSMENVSKVAQEIKLALHAVGQIQQEQKSFESLNDENIAKYADRHEGMLKEHFGGAGYKYVLDQVSQGMAEHPKYAEQLTKAAESLEKQRADEEAKKEHDAEKADHEATEKSQSDEPAYLLKHGTAPYKHEEGAKRSYYVELSDGKVLWGLGLEDAIDQSGAELGDVVTVSRIGEKDVTVMVDVKDEFGKTIGTEPLDTQRIEWEVDIKAKANDEQRLSALVSSIEALTKQSASMRTTKPKDADVLEVRAQVLMDKVVAITSSDPFKENNELSRLYAQSQKRNLTKVTYQFDNDKGVVKPLFNGQSASSISSARLEVIRKNDPFLGKYTLDQIKQGELDMKQAQGTFAIDKTFDRQGVVVETTQQTHRFTDS